MENEVSNCHSYPVLDDGSCRWCGKNTGVHLFRDDPLLKEIESSLCDWNSPRRLQTYDLIQNVHTVAVLVIKDRERNEHGSEGTM